MASRPPYLLWADAHDEFPDDPRAAKLRYRELMIEHGHLVPAKPGESRNLPCGWPHLEES